MADIKPGRRGFLSWLWYGLGAAAVAEAVWVVISFARPRRVRVSDEPESLIVAGPVSDFQPGTVTAFRRGRFYLVRLEDGGFLALHRKCPHLGCTVPWDSGAGRFACPCHASTFDIRGDVMSPPAPRSLDLFLVRIENEFVKVDVAKPIRRESFSPSQIVRS